MSSKNIYLQSICSCVICKKEYSVKGIFSHYIGSHGTPEQKAKLTGKGLGRKTYTEASKEKHKNKNDELNKIYLENPSKCKYCNIAMEYKSRNNKYCSRKCAATQNNKERDYSQIKTGPDKGYKFYGRNISSRAIYRSDIPYTKVFKCKVCLKYFAGSSNRTVCDDAECRYNNLKGKRGGYRENSTRKTRSFYNGYQMDSGAELSFAKLLDSHNIKWIKNNSMFFTYNDTRKYYPDFYLEEYNLWVEIKGKYYYNPSIDPIKWSVVPNLEVIWHNDIKLPTVCKV